MQNDLYPPPFKHHYPPDAIMHLAARDPVVKALLMEFLAGRMHWEQALQGMVVELAKEAYQLRRQELKRLEREIQPIIVNEVQ